MFSFISMNWRGQPLVSYETVIKLIGGTTTNKGLSVAAHIDEREYEKGIKFSDDDMAQLQIQPHVSCILNGIILYYQEILVCVGGVDFDRLFFGGPLTTYDEIIQNPGDIKPLDDGYRDYYFDKYGYRFIGLDSGADYNVSLHPSLESSNVSTLVSYDSWYDHSPESDGLKEIQLTRLSKIDSGMPKIIFMHHPAISASDDESVTGSSELPVTNNCPLEYSGNDACIAFNRCKFIDYCVNNTTDLVLTGHTHRDYVKTVFSELETHKTWFIQTRSATKDPDPYNYHGYRVIEITDEGVVPHISEMTEETLKKSERYTYSAHSNLLDHIRIYAYVISGSNITGILPDGTTKRDIPDSYYTGVLDKLPQIIRCYNEMPNKFKFGLKLLPADTSDTTTQRAIEEEHTIIPSS